MNILLDTHVWLWWLIDSPSLSRRARTLIESDEHLVYVSVISLWEAVLKAGLGKLDLPEGLEEATLASDFKFMPFVARHALRVAQLPSHHRDPFDRALIAQAATEGFILLTVDSKFENYSAFADIVIA